MKIIDVDLYLHYTFFQSWWDGHGVNDVPRGVIENVPGFAARTDDGKYLAVAWVYKAKDIPIFWLAWITTNPNASAKETYRGLEYILFHVNDIMREEGYHSGFCNSANDGVTRFLEKRGWEVNHNVTQLITII